MYATLLSLFMLLLFVARRERRSSRGRLLANACSWVCVCVSVGKLVWFPILTLFAFLWCDRCRGLSPNNNSKRYKRVLSFKRFYCHKFGEKVLK